jgi:Zn finger protein HypA/HybF involved in hydrogenase expression
LLPTNHSVNSKDEGSEKMETTIAFKCPSCKSIFEFDPIGENEFVSCPICGNDFRTVKNGETLKLEPLEFESITHSDLSPSVFHFEFELLKEEVK